MDEKSSLLPRISVTRPVTVTMCLVAILAVGLVSYARIRIQAFPSGRDWPGISMRIDTLPNSSARERDEQIGRPVMEHFRTLKDLHSLTVGSRKSHLSVYLMFKKDADMTEVYNRVTDRLERLKVAIPEEAQARFRIYKYNPDTDQEILWVGVGLPPQIEDPYYFIQSRIQPRLERLDGVGRITIWGASPMLVAISVDQERLRARGVSAYELARTLRDDNFDMSGGTVFEGGKRFYVRSVARYTSLGEIEEIPIHTQNGIVRIKEVADVFYDLPRRYLTYRIDGRPFVSLGVFRTPGANIAELCDRVEVELKEIKAETGVHLDILYNQGKQIRESMENLRNTALWGGLFAALVLLFFLRAARMTALITLAIPVCVMIAVTVLYFIDWSLNLLTMMGLMIAVGMVVDNAIVIVENIYRIRSKDTGAREASVRGAGEVGLAITTATLTTVVVFLPLMVMSGDVDLSFFLTKIGVSFIAALLGSLFVALIFIPLAAERFGGSEVKPDPKSIRWVRTGYHRALAWAMTHRRDAVLIAVALFATMLYPMEKVKKSDSLRGEVNSVRIRGYPPRFLDGEELSDIGAEMEAFLDTKREAYGIRNVRFSYRVTGGSRLFFRIFLEEEDNRAWWYQAYKGLRNVLGHPVERRMDREAVIEDLNETLPAFVGHHFVVESRLPVTPYVHVNLRGNDVETLQRLAEEVAFRVKSIPSVTGVQVNTERSENELLVLLNRERMSKYGIQPDAVGRSIAYQVGGVDLPRYRSDERETDLRLYLNRLDRQTLFQLKNFTFRSKSGEKIPLSAFASFRAQKGDMRVWRYDGKIQLQVEIQTTKEDLKGLYEEVDRAMVGFRMPTGYSWNKGERYSNFKETEQTMTFAVILAITCVYLLMGVLFESFLLPFSVLFCIPFAFMGVYWTLYLTDTVMDQMAQVGIIVLIGVVVNNAIVLVDVVNRLRTEGKDRTEAILVAGNNRFRPILMTTFTTVFGLVPVSLASNTLMGVPYSSMGRAMMGGLLCATFLTLFVVPLFYTYLDDLRVAMKRIVSGAFTWGRAISQRSPEPAD